MTTHQSPRIDTLVFTVPRDDADAVLAALFAAGAGCIGDYTECAFTVDGVGQFRPVGDADPTIGTVGEIERVEERRCEVPFTAAEKEAILAALVAAHPYEEPSFFVIANAA